MITFVETRSREEWTADLPPWKGGALFRFELHPGLNVLFGPNGSGKSTIMRAIAHFTFTQGAKQSYFRPLDLPSGARSISHEDVHDKHRHEPPGLTIDAGWAGSRVIHLDPMRVDNNQDMDSILEEPGSLGSWLGRRKASGGENALILLGSYLKGCSKLSTAMEGVKEPQFNEMWMGGIRYFNSLVPKPDDGVERKLTVLLDESDRSASVAWQSRIWNQLRGLANAGVQVVAISHSIAALELADKVIETEPGCVAETMRLIRRVAALPYLAPEPGTDEP